MKDKKGFTLIEVLSIILLIFIILLITIYVIGNIIEKSKESTNLMNANKLKNILTEYYIKAGLSGNKFNGYECIFPDNCTEIKLDGKKPSSGKLSISKDGKINGIVSYDEQYYFKFDNDNIKRITSDEINE